MEGSASKSLGSSWVHTSLWWWILFAECLTCITWSQASAQDAITLTWKFHVCWIHSWCNQCLYWERSMQFWCNSSADQCRLLLPTALHATLMSTRSSLYACHVYCCLLSASFRYHPYWLHFESESTTDRADLQISEVAMHPHAINFLNEKKPSAGIGMDPPLVLRLAIVRGFGDQFQSIRIQGPLNMDLVTMPEKRPWKSKWFSVWRAPICWPVKCFPCSRLLVHFCCLNVAGNCPSVIWRCGHWSNWVVSKVQWALKWKAIQC